jgi:hypothetical protein
MSPLNLSEMKTVLIHSTQNKMKDRMTVLLRKRRKRFSFSPVLRSLMKDMSLRLQITFLVSLLLLNKM